MNIKKIVFYFILVGVFVITCFAVGYVLKWQISDFLQSNESMKQIELKRASKYFPDTIGEYSVSNEPEQKIKIVSTCNKIENNNILKEMGRTGDACMETFTALYGKVISSITATTTSKIVKVNLSRFTEAGDLLHLLVEKTTEPDILDGKAIFHTVPFRLGWFPASRFDLIITDEGESLVSSTTSLIKYEGTATGDNDVTRYFISKYPPGE
ncbi:MAG: hypothetical protein WCW03_02965 [Candidatus Paceibacterota bacterium]|jgi:hypothetical protein